MSKRPPPVVVMFCPQFRPLVGGTECCIPRGLIYRRRWRFTFPVAHWLRGRLAPLIDEVMFDASLMAPGDGVVMWKTVKKSQEQYIDQSSRFWALL